MTEQSRRRRIVIALAAVGVLILGAVISWNALAAADARNDIDAIPRWLTCGGVEIPYDIVYGDEQSAGVAPQPAFVIPYETLTKPDTICQLELTLVNEGSRDVRIKDVSFPTLGVTGNGGFPIELSENGANFPATSPDDGLKAVVGIDSQLGSGDTLDLLFDLRARESGRMVSGIATVYMLPEIEFSYRGFTHTTNGSVGIAVSRR